MGEWGEGGVGEREVYMKGVGVLYGGDGGWGGVGDVEGVCEEGVMGVWVVGFLGGGEGDGLGGDVEVGGGWYGGEREGRGVVDGEDGEGVVVESLEGGVIGGV